MHSIVTAFLATCFSAATIGAPAHAGTLDQGNQAAGTPRAQLSPREAGVRYGQAMGVARLCYGLRTTAAAGELERTYQGADGGDAFRAEAEKVLASWQDALGCAKAGGPNECRLIYEMSCRDAYREIGPEGSRLPGLIERVK
jgi:hypothetical protein